MTQRNYNSRANRYINPVFYTNKQTTAFLSLESIFPFGKYKGRKVVDIIGEDLPYILWAKKQRVFLFDESAIIFIREKRKESEEKLNITYKPKEHTPYVRVDRNKNCKTVYVFDDKYNQIMTFESVAKTAEHFNTNSAFISYHIKNRKPINDKYLLSYSEYLLFID